MTLKSPPGPVVHEMAADAADLTGVRRSVRRQLRAWGRDDLADAAQLCVTELLTNVLRHAGSPRCELRLEQDPAHGAVRLAVSDRSHVLPVRAPVPDWTAERGRGLHLIGATAHRWGSVLTAGGKTVWVELR